MRFPSIETAPGASALRLQARLLANARRRRWRRHTSTLALAGMLVPIAAFVAWRRLQTDVGVLFALLRSQTLALAVAAFALAWMLTRNARRRAQRAFANSWLATAPVDAREVLAATRRQVAWRVAPLFAAVLAVPLLAVAAGGIDALQTPVLLGAGFAAGTLAGWRSGARPVPVTIVAVPRLSARRKAPSDAASLVALARWPFARLLAGADPRLHAQLIAGVLLMLPMSMPPSVALLTVLLAAILIAAHSLLQALLATIPDAAAWTRATPLPFGTFARTLCLRSAIALATAILSAALPLRLLGVSPKSTFAFAGVALVWCVTAIGNALASRHRPDRVRGERVALALAVLALLGSAWWLLPVLLPLLWWRDAVRARRA